MSIDTKRKTFLIISGSENRLDQISTCLQKHYDRPVIYTAPNGNIGLLKIKNSPPDIIVADCELETINVLQMVDTILVQNLNPRMAIIIVGHPPEEEKFLDELVMGKIYFTDQKLTEDEFAHCLAKALNYNSQTEVKTYQLRYLAAGDLLIKEGEKADYVYILKRGQLHAFNTLEGKKNIIGLINVGEFVGEMAYINNEQRSASVEALTDSELIEIPIDYIDKILYKRPAWSKALMQTLSKRLKTANKFIVN